MRVQTKVQLIGGPGDGTRLVVQGDSDELALPYMPPQPKMIFRKETTPPERVEYKVAIYLRSAIVGNDGSRHFFFRGYR